MADHPPEVSEPNASTEGKDQLVEEILRVEAEIERIEGQLVRKRDFSRRLFDRARKGALVMFLGPGLSRSLGQLLQALKEDHTRILGEEMARTIDLLSRKVIGYKRWLVLLTLLGSLPGIISMLLLIQQTGVLREEKAQTQSDIWAEKRLRYLATIYSTYGGTEHEMLTAPINDARSRRDAALSLIRFDSAHLQANPDLDVMSNYIDLGIAPLQDVDFTPWHPGDPESLEWLGLVNSGLGGASFQGMELDTILFSNAYLIETDLSGTIIRNSFFDEAILTSTNFRDARLENCDFESAIIQGADFTGATFVECNFAGATADAATLWTEGFDLEAAGILPPSENSEPEEGN